MSLKQVPPELIAQINAKFHRAVIPANATWAEYLIGRTFLEIARGNIGALHEIVDRIEGKAPQRMELLGLERQEIVFRVTHEELPSGRERAEKMILQNLVELIEQPDDSDDEEFLTKAAEFAATIEARLKRKEKPIDVTPR